MRKWRIDLYDTMDLKYRVFVPENEISERGLEGAIKALVAKYCLSDDEIVGAFCTDDSKRRNTHLDIRVDPTGEVWECGSNPHLVAKLVREDA